MNAKAHDNDNRSVAGDPGVGGLLADPTETDRRRDEIDPGAGPISADPPPPRHHRDWSPNKKPAEIDPQQKALHDA
jgi:hypothetical protein